MNRSLYRLVFSKRLGMLVAVSEIAVRQGKAAGGEGDRKTTRGLPLLAAAIALAFGLGNAYANPMGGVVTTGTAKMNPSGNSMTINQSSQNLGINWQGFNINANESVIFKQPNASAIALNRVIGTDGSKIMGQLQANGQVFLINPNGILFGKSAQVNTGGLVASTLDLSEADFLAGKRTFSGRSQASVINQGTLSAKEGGYIALLGNQVANQGIITAHLGSVGLAAGSQVSLDLAGDRLLDVKVDQAAYLAQADNHGLVQADGGKVIMTASAKEALLDTVINNSGVIQAQTVDNQGGVIRLLGGDAGTTVVAGKLDASAPKGGDGGTIETSGAHVKVADNAQITTAAAAGKTGQWLVDPVDFTVAVSGGDMTGAALSNELNATNVTLQSSNGTVNGSGNINVNDNVSWSANTTLTLQAVNDVNVNRNITATGDTAGLAMLPGSGHYNLNQGAQITLSGATPNLNIAGNSYTVINDVNALQNMNANGNGNYALGQNIDASATGNWNNGTGFTPITQLNGRFDGLGHVIQNLMVNHVTGNGTGLFGITGSTADIRNVGLVGGTITGNSYVGALVGQNGGNVSNSYATGAVNGQTYSYTYYTLVCRSWTCYNVPTTYNYASNYTGGLVGYNMSTGTINNSYATGMVTTQQNTTYPSGYAGGLAGYNNGTINNSYAGGPPVNGQNYVGGLVGLNDINGKINTSYAATGASGSHYVGNLAGLNSGTINNSYAGGMENAASYTGFDFTNTWRIYEGHTTPLLQSFLKPLTITANNASKTYDGTNYQGGNGINCGATSCSDSHLFNTAGYNGTAQNARNAGTYTLISDAYSDQQGYNINAVAGTLTVTPKALTVTGQTALDKTYDGTTAATLTGGSLSGVIAADQVSLASGSGAFADKNAGANKAVTVTGTALSGSDAGNYTIANPTGLTATINKASLTVSATANNKVYDGTTHATASLQDNRIAGDHLNVIDTSAAFADKNAGSSKQVMVSGISISGADAGNYTLANTSASTTADIARANLTLSAVADSKTYDGTTASSGNVKAAGLVGGDTISGLGQSFDSRNAGSRILSVNNGYVINDGNNGNNYTVLSQAASGTVNKASLLLSATSDRKVYDGTTASSGTVQAAGLVGSDNISGLAQSFDSRNAGSRNLAVNSGYNVNDGNNGNNYVVATKTATGLITPKALTLTGQAAQDKTYDGTSSATLVGGSLAGVVGADNVTLVSGAGHFADRNAGSNKAVTVTGTGLNGSDAANYTVADPTGLTATINKAALALAAGTDSKMYDGTTASSGVVSATGLVGGDTVSGLGQAFDSRNAGSRTLSVNNGYTINDGNNGNNYTVTTQAASGTIDKASLALSAVSDSKVYDGTTRSSGVVQATGLVGGDSINGLAQSFDSKNAGPRTLAVNNGYTLNDGNNGQNYTVTTSTAAGSITPKGLAVTGQAAVDKTYDANTNATLQGGALSGVVAGDNVSLVSGAAAFSDKNVGANKAVTVTGTGLSGSDAGNYTVTDPTGLTASISKATLAVTATASNKVYDGTTAATASLQGNHFAGDNLSVSSTGASFADKNAGNGKTVTVNGINISGADAGNYTLASTSATTIADISKAALTLSAVADSKTYDGSVDSAGAVGVSGLVGGDTVSGLSQAFDSRNAGSRTLAVNGNYSINDGNNGHNYTVTTNTASGTIARASLTLAAVADSKTYDGTTDSTGAVGVTGLVSGDSMSGLGQSFDSRNAGSRILAVNNGYTVNDGNNGNNYMVAATTAAGTITPKALTVAGQVAQDKTYDGTNGATLQGGALSGVIGSDQVSLVSGSGSFADKNAGINKTVTVAGTALSGSDAGNYTVTDPTGLTATINKATLTVSATADNKVYDGTTLATASLQDNRIAGDHLSLGSTGASFADKNAGTGKQVTVTGISVSGADAANYTLANDSASTTADISKANLTLAAATDARTYDGTTASSGVVSATGLVGGDTVSGLGQAFDSRNAGSRTLSVNNGYTINDGNNGNNYTVTTQAASGTIDKASLALSAVSDSKVYDGTTRSSGIVQATGLVGGDSINGLAQSFDSKNAGPRTLAVNNGYTLNDGNNGQNYTVTTSTAAGSITPKGLAVTGQAAVDKTYDANTNATLQGGALSGVVAGDNVSLVSGAAAFSDKNVGANKAVTVTGTGLAGSDAGNYTITDPTGLTASISKATLAVTAIASNKVYDGTTAATASLQDNHFAGDNLSVSSTGASFADKNAGNGKTVTVNGLTISGTDAGNYSLAGSTATTTASITPASLVLSAVSDSKTYDGSTASTGTVKAGGLVGGDTITGASQSFDSKNAGARTLAVNGGYTVNDGNHGNNYTVTTQAASGQINRASLALAAVTDSKTYDGTTASSGVVQVAGLVAGDSVSGLSQVFDSRNADARTLSVNAYTLLDGNNGQNYSVITRTASGSINKALLVLQPVTDSKVFDNTLTSSGMVQALGLVAGDRVSNLTQSFVKKTPGDQALVVNDGYAINDGNNGQNYLVTTGTATGHIYPPGCDHTMCP